MDPVSRMQGSEVSLRVASLGSNSLKHKPRSLNPTLTTFFRAPKEAHKQKLG